MSLKGTFVFEVLNKEYEPEVISEIELDSRNRLVLFKTPQEIFKNYQVTGISKESIIVASINKDQMEIDQMGMKFCLDMKDSSKPIPKDELFVIKKLGAFKPIGEVGLDNNIRLIVAKPHIVPLAKTEDSLDMKRAVVVAKVIRDQNGNEIVSRYYVLKDAIVNAANQLINESLADDDFRLIRKC